MSDAAGAVVGIAIAMVRALCVLAMLPMGGGSSMSKTFVFAMAAAVGLCVRQALDVPDIPSMALYVLALKEAVIGIGLGWMINRLFFVVGAAGALLDQWAGYTMGQLFNPNLGRSTGPIESIYSTLLILILMTAGGGFYLPKVILATYQVWPITQFVPPASVESFMAGLLGQGLDELIDFSFQMVMPIMAMLMFSDICVGLFARYAQEFNPMSASLAVKAWLVALMMVVSVLAQLGYIQRLMRMLMRVQ